MADQYLQLNHKKYALNFIIGRVTATNMWSESRTSGGGGSMVIVGGFGGGHKSAVRTTVTNHLEFWVNGDDGVERCYKVDANQVKVREGQDVKLIEATKRNGKRSDLVMVYNVSQQSLYRLKGPFGMVVHECPWLFIPLIAFMIFGFFGWTSPVWGPLHLLSLVVGIPYFYIRRRYYAKKFKAIRSSLFGM